MFQKYYREWRANDPVDEQGYFISRGHPMGLLIADDLGDGNIAYGWSFCSRRDTFNRSLARLIASNRLESRKYMAKIFVPEDVEDLKAQIPNGACDLEALVDDSIRFFMRRYELKKQAA